MNVSQEFLTTIAEIAVALIGFSGVVTILGRRHKGRWQSDELLQLRTLVEPSICALFGALLPGTLVLIVDNSGLLWRLSNAILGLFVLIALVLFLLRTRTATTSLGQRILTVVCVVVLLGLGLSAVDYVEHHQFTFVAGLWLALIVAIYNFTLLLFKVEGDTFAK